MSNTSVYRLFLKTPLQNLVIQNVWCSGYTENQKPKSGVKRRTAQQINFFTDVIRPLNKLKLCKRKSKSSEEDYNKCTLPQKFLTENSTNNGFMLKPLCKPNPDFLKKPLTNVSAQNVENNSEIPEGSFQDAAFENVSVHEEVVYSNAAATCAKNLNDFPETVHQNFKGYVAKEKRMNVKSLKCYDIEKSRRSKRCGRNDAKKKFFQVYSEISCP